MTSKFKFENDDVNGIFYKHFYGTITVEDVIKSWDEAMRDNIIPNGTKRFIINFLNGHAAYKAENTKLLENFYQNHAELFKGVRIAIVTIIPEDIIVPMLMKRESGLYCLAPFSTIEAAVDWVMLPSNDSSNLSI
jgi:hypothetical protein